MMKEVTKYQADDGTEFNTAAECLQHEKMRELARKLDSTPDLYWRETSPDEVAEWLFNNRDYVLSILS